MVRVDASTRRSLVDRLRAAGCVFAEDEAELLVAEARTRDELDAMADRRRAGLPLEYVVGWAEFCGLRVGLIEGVFVPRARTEFLANVAIGLAGQRTGLVVVDLCCGSGAVGLAVLAALDGAELFAVDIEPVAVRCARENIGSRGRVFEGDLFDPLPASLRGHVDLLLANVPYVPTPAIALMPREARLFEAGVALDGGPDGLDVMRRVATRASDWLARGGHLLVECGDDQARDAATTLGQGGLLPRIEHSRELDATVLVGTRP